MYMYFHLIKVMVLTIMHEIIVIVNRKIFLSAKFRICNFRVQIIFACQLTIRKFNDEDLLTRGSSDGGTTKRIVYPRSPYIYIYIYIYISRPSENIWTPKVFRFTVFLINHSWGTKGKLALSVRSKYLKYNTKCTSVCSEYFVVGWLLQ